MKIPPALRDGYRRFRHERFRAEAERYRVLAKKGQQPRTMLIGCADSRVDPATILSAGPGELFVVRNVAALVPPYDETAGYHGTSAALEFAVTSLEVADIVVMGHGMCGGIAASLAAVEQRPVGRFIGPWVDLISGIRDELLERGVPLHPEHRQKALERMAVQQSLVNLMTFPFVRDRVDRGLLALHGAWFSIAEAELQWLDWDAGVFEPVAPSGPH